jgi:trehalose/maltose hydrolase-like predicted phosphorylase
MTPHWDGQATVFDRIDGAGARRLVQTGGGSHGLATVDLTFRTQTTGTAGTVASTVKPAPSPPPRPSAAQDNSISPVGLTSDNYAGLIFWDAETWMYPGLLLLHPGIAKSVLEYRYRALSGARANAQRLGFQGVFYPWNSASNGDLATECHSVDPPHCITQVHAGPDEYSNGVRDGVYTNAVAATALRNATKAAQILGEAAPSQRMS